MNAALEFQLELPSPRARGFRQALYRQLRAAMLDGRLAAGVQLPASRALAEALGVSRNSVVAVYDLLLSEGLVSSKVGAGTFVAPALAARPSPTEAAGVVGGLPPPPRPAPPSEPHEAFADDLRPGLPDASLFPFEIWGRLSGRTLRAFSKASPGYREPAGSPALRQAIAAHLSFARAMAVAPRNIVVTTGAQHAFDLLARLLAARAGTVVAVEDPGYPETRAAFELAGASVRGVPVDEQGIVVERIPRDARVISVTPSHQFPTGTPLSRARRRALLARAAEHQALVIEDDYGGEFRFGRGPIDTLRSMDREGRVFYVGTFSSSLLPALRIGFIVAPDWALEALVAARAASDWHGPALEQGTLAAFISEGHLARHIRRMRKVYANRHAALMSALQDHCTDRLRPALGASGLHVAAFLRGRADLPLWKRRAALAGIRVETLDEFALTPSGPAGFALGFGLIEAARIPDAVRRLAEAAP